MNSFKFYINKYAFIKDEIPDTSFIPMLMRRKLDNFGKAGLYTLYNVYDNDKNYKLIFASCYGDIERVIKLINQRKEEGEISPTGFSFSVHNATIGLFSLLNSIKSSYNSISANEETIANALLEAIIDSKKQPVIFCYTENDKTLESIAISISQNRENEESTEVTINITNNDEINPISFNNLVEFINGKTKILSNKLYTLIRG